jgi:hypothetical protein
VLTATWSRRDARDALIFAESRAAAGMRVVVAAGVLARGLACRPRAALGGELLSASPSRR